MHALQVAMHTYGKGLTKTSPKVRSGDPLTTFHHARTCQHTEYIPPLPQATQKCASWHFAVGSGWGGGREGLLNESKAPGPREVEWNGMAWPPVHTYVPQRTYVLGTCPRAKKSTNTYTPYDGVIWCDRQTFSALLACLCCLPTASLDIPRTSLFRVEYPHSVLCTYLVGTLLLRFPYILTYSVVDTTKRMDLGF